MTSSFASGLRHRFSFARPVALVALLMVGIAACSDGSMTRPDATIDSGDGSAGDSVSDRPIAIDASDGEAGPSIDGNSTDTATPDAFDALVHDVPADTARDSVDWDGDSGPSCVPGCPTEGATRCESGASQTCTRGSTGCLEWSAPTACSDGFCEDPVRCGTCVHECAAPGATACAGGSIRTCVTDSRGCRVLGPSSACASGFCADATACGTCTNTCSSAGATSCTSGAIRTCVADTNGCLAWGPSAACASGFCADTSTCGSCVHSCSAVGDTECATGQQRTCIADANGCRAWSALIPCASGFCDSATACHVCSNTCPAAGATLCSAGQLQTCTADAYSCLAWSAPSPCAESFCASTASCGVCTNTCPTVGATQCAAGRIQSCISDANGCRSWGAATNCTSGFCADATSCGVEVDECTLGTYSCPTHSHCTNTVGSYRCDCDCGFFADTPTTCADQFPHILFVDSRRPTNGNGDCWSNAFRDLWVALAAARTGDELWLAQGTYRPNTAALSTSATFSLPAGVSIYGGFTGTETMRSQRNATTNVTILSGTFGTSHVAHIVTVPSDVGPDSVIDGVIVDGGNARGALPAYGGGMLVQGSPVIRSCTFRNNYGDYGGAVAVDRGQPLVDSCTFTNNTVFSTGACFYATGAATTVTIRNSQFQGAATGQCAFFDRSGPTTVTDSTFTGNTSVRGAAIYSVDTQLSITRSTFTSNRGSEYGGAIYSLRGRLVVAASGFTSNSCRDFGGAIAADASELAIDTTTFTTNSTMNRDGAGVYATNVTSGRISNSSFQNGNAYNGGGVAVSNSPGFRIEGSTFSANARVALAIRYQPAYVSDCTFESNPNGAINASQADLVLLRSVFRSNTSTDGAGLSAQGASASRPNSIEVVDSVFDSNWSTNAGGAMSLTWVRPALFGVRFAGNRAGNGTTGTGGAIIVDSSGGSIVNCTFAGNTSPTGGAVRIGSAFVTPTPIVTIVNSVFWGNAPTGLSVASGADVRPTYSCFDVATVGLGNLLMTSSPFVDGDGMDDMYGTRDDVLHLVPGSVCADSGDGSAVPTDRYDLDSDGDITETVPLDLDALPRTVGVIDRGGYEQQP